MGNHPALGRGECGPYRWITQGETTPKGIADFLIFDTRMPRSLAFSARKISANLAYLESNYGLRHPCHDLLSMSSWRG